MYENRCSRGGDSFQISYRSQHDELFRPRKKANVSPPGQLLYQGSMFAAAIHFDAYCYDEEPFVRQPVILYRRYEGLKSGMAVVEMLRDVECTTVLCHSLSGLR